MQQLIQAGQNVQARVHLSRYDFTMCSCWHQDQYWVMLRKSQVLRPLSSMPLFKSRNFQIFWYCRPENLPNVDRTWQKDSPALLSLFVNHKTTWNLTLCKSSENTENFKRNAWKASFLFQSGPCRMWHFGHIMVQLVPQLLLGSFTATLRSLPCFWINCS